MTGTKIKDFTKTAPPTRAGSEHLTAGEPADKHKLVRRGDLESFAVGLLLIKLDVFGKIMRGGAYAFGVYNDEIVGVLKTLGLSYFRTTETNDSFEIPKDWLRWRGTCRHAAENLFELLDKFLAAKPDLHYNAKPLLFTLWGHSYEFEDSNNWEIIERFGEKVAAQDDIWHATNAEIYDYTKAYESLIFSAAGDKVFNPSPVDIYLWANRRRVIAKANAVTNLE
jgi:hypothetical protein